MTGRSLSPGTPSSDRALLVANQAGQHVGLAVLQPDHRVDRAVAERRQAAEAGARDAAHLDLQRQRHLVVVVRARRDVDVDADVLVVERRDRLLVCTPPAAIGAKVVTGTGTRSPNRACAGDAFRRAQLRVGQRARVRCRSSAAGSRAPAGWSASTSACVRFAQVAQRQAVAG